jgi:hypothetical protein
MIFVQLIREIDKGFHFSLGGYFPNLNIHESLAASGVSSSGVDRFRVEVSALLILFLWLP